MLMENRTFANVPSIVACRIALLTLRKISKFHQDVVRVPGGRACYPVGPDGPNEQCHDSQKKINILVMFELTCQFSCVFFFGGTWQKLASKLKMVV